MLNSNLCLVITGTVKPNIIFGQNDINVEIRKLQYLFNLHFYSQFPYEIFFLENSTYDFSEDNYFQYLFNYKNIRLIKFPESKAIMKGKGYQEFEIIDRFIKSYCDNYESFIKISGRYLYKNILEISQMKCDNLIIDLYKKSQSAITSIFFSKVDFYKEYLENLYRKVDDSNKNYIEKVIYQELVTKKITRKIDLFYTTPIYEIPFSINHYNLKKLKIYIRNIERLMLRKLNLKLIIL